MAQFNSRFMSHAQVSDKAQPRHLPRWEPAQQCHWTDCTTQAASQHKGKVYCTSHLLKVLQQQWQG